MKKDSWKKIYKAENVIKKKGFWKDNRGVGVIEVVLILVIIFTIYKGCK